MTSSQMQFKRKLKGFGILLVFLFFTVMSLSVYKAAAGPLASPVQQEEAEHGSDGKQTDPGRDQPR